MRVTFLVQSKGPGDISYYCRCCRAYVTETAATISPTLTVGSQPLCGMGAWGPPRAIHSPRQPGPIEPPFGGRSFRSGWAAPGEAARSRDRLSPPSAARMAGSGAQKMVLVLSH